MSAAGPAWLTPAWPAPARVRAAATLRGGGVSPAPYATLNLGTHVGDDPAAVAENRRRLAEALALPAEPLWLSQVHGTGVIDADARRVTGAPTPAGAPPQADAAVARAPGQPLVILVADCLPVLFASDDGAVIGIAHAGWRGLAAGVLEATVAALGQPPAQLHTWVGPGIGPAHFEVGDEVRVALCSQDPGAAEAFQPNPRGRWQCDLQRLTRRRLAHLGIQSVHGQPRCTFAEPDAFFSYRRDGVTGRMAALIWLEA